MKYSLRWKIISKGFVQDSIKSEFLNSEFIPKTEGSGISDIVSELLKHIDSKESFDFISDLLLTSLNIYQKKFSIENAPFLKEKEFGETNRRKNLGVKYETCDSIIEYLTISNEIHLVLSGCPDLTKNQKLDYCSSQRYFMKMYMKEIMTRLKLKKN